jgi:hypothetical protein
MVHQNLLALHCMTYARSMHGFSTTIIATNKASRRPEVALKFALELVELLIAMNKAVPSTDNVGKPCRPPNRKSVEVRLHVGTKACHTKS